jgi:excisionase family DNA binding protein
MNSRIIAKDDERLASLSRTIDELSEAIENIAHTSGPEPGNEQYLTDRDLSRLLKISRRCLQDYRTEGKIPFYKIGGKILYRASDIERFLEEHYANRHSDRSFINT